jgi:hypothetical protein
MPTQSDPCTDSRCKDTFIDAMAVRRSAISAALSWVCFSFCRRSTVRVSSWRDTVNADQTRQRERETREVYIETETLCFLFGSPQHFTALAQLAYRDFKTRILRDR